MRGFKLLWEKEKSIDADRLKQQMRKISKLKEQVVTEFPDAAEYYKWAQMFIKFIILIAFGTFL